MKKNILLNYFLKNNLTPRKSQINCLNWLNENLTNFNYFILQLPTGVGKSHIGLSLSELNTKNLYISSTNQLLDQYINIDKTLVDIKGMQNYKCALDKSFNCFTSKCKTDKKIKEECLSKKICPYYNQRDKFINSKMGLTNYAFMTASAGCGIFSENFFSEDFKYDFIICDEAHNLENHLINFATININIDQLNFKKIILGDYYLNENSEWETILNICYNIKDEIQNKLKLLKAKIRGEAKSKNLNKRYLKKLWNEYYYLDRMIFPINILTLYPNKDQWVCDIDSNNNSFKIVPLNVDFVFDRYIKPLSDKIIFMSATIGDSDVFIKSLGLDKNKTCFYECDSPFDPKKSPIVLIEKLNLSYNNIDSELKNVLKYVEAISKKHVNENGIIHSGNYKIANYIFKNASIELQNRLVFKEKFNNANNSKLLSIHESNSLNNNSILLSPSLYEGVDLKDDYSRWQIIIKLPFLSLGDKRIKYLAANYPSWYTNDVVKKVIQACGRSTRHDKDYSITYILDKICSYTFNKVNIPIWFKKRLIKLNKGG